LYLCIKLRSISKGEMFNYSFQCDNMIKNEDGTETQCDHIFKESDTIDSLLVVKNSDVTKTLCEVNSKLSLELKVPSIDYYNYLADIDDNLEAEIEFMDDEAYLQKKNLEMFCNQVCFAVSKVIIKDDDGKPHVYTNFTPDEFKENILMNLSFTELGKIFEQKKKLISMTIRIRKVCPKCQAVFERDEKNFFEYVV